MSDAPTTFHGEPDESSDAGWYDRASLHRANDGDGVFDGLKALRQGSLAELVRFVRDLPDGERDKYAIQKDGDRRIDAAEIASLAERPDFPA